MSGRPKRVRARKSKKGRLAAPRREELNEERSQTEVTAALAAKERGGKTDTMFARVTGHLGMGRVKARLPTGKDSVEIYIQIPNVFGRKGVTPINSQTVVAVYVGLDFDPLAFDATVHFKMTSILNDMQAGQLVEAEVIPSWMTSTADPADAAAKGEEEAYVFDYSGVKEGGDEESEDEESGDSKDEEKDKDSSEEEKSKGKNVVHMVADATAGAAAAKPADKSKAKAAKPDHRKGGKSAAPEDDDPGFSFE
jgi:hypothetical protein